MPSRQIRARAHVVRAFACARSRAGVARSGRGGAGPPVRPVGTRAAAATPNSRSPSVGRDEAPTLAVRLAPPAAFRAANLEYNAALTNLRFALDRRPDGNYVVRITFRAAGQRAVSRRDGRTDLGHRPRHPRVHGAARSAVAASARRTSWPRPRRRLRAAATAAGADAPAPRAGAAGTAPHPAARSAAARACAGREAAPAPTPAPTASTAAGGTYTVKSGDTLGKIANQNRSAGVARPDAGGAVPRQSRRVHQQEHEPAARRERSCHSDRRRGSGDGRRPRRARKWWPRAPTSRSIAAGWRRQPVGPPRWRNGADRRRRRRSGHHQGR